ncbi:Bug family tripartite tricarboxylate transporter substrate binding protein [Candidimonas nitroreducens]|nr:tripartite tricarboxylate transporter substrate binding protein [Candidimonas nitroreducens]
MKFRNLMFASLAAGAAVLSAPTHAAGPYPDHPVTIVVPFGAGGSADEYTRVVAAELQRKLGQPFIVENKVGAGGVVGTAYASHAKPDGYTLLTTGNAQLIGESLRKNRPYVFLRDFTAVAPINEADLVLVVNSKLKVHTVGDLIALAKAEPGKLNYASAGVGTPYHLAGELFKSMAHINVTRVPYKSSGEARMAVLSGQVAYMFDSVATMASSIKQGKVRALATAGPSRSAVLPDVPTLDEAGLKGYRATVLVGLAAPVGTPAPILDKLNAAVTSITGSPKLSQSWAGVGVRAMSMSRGEFERYLRDEIQKYAKIVDDAKIPSL